MRLTEVVRGVVDWRPSPAVTDVIVVCVVAFPTLMDAWWNEAGTPQADWITYGLGVVSVAALLVRRRWPIAVTLVCALALTGWNIRDQYGELLNLPTMVGLYTIAVQRDRRVSVAVGVIAATWGGILAAADPAPAGAVEGPPVLEMLWPLVPLMLGEVVRGRRELLAEYALRARLAETEREHEARHRVAEERLRIARDLHDLVAHTMAAVNVQMSVAEAAFDRQPDTAREAIGQARASSKEALHELRAAIALLRESDGTEGVALAPRLGEIGELVETARAAGIEVTVTDETVNAELPAAVEQAVYRIVQEALTNVVRHSGARHAAVSLVLDDVGLAVTVVDDGRLGEVSDRAHLDRPGVPREPGPVASRLVLAEATRAQTEPRSGFGLQGMQERVAALDGSLQYGTRRDGGFEVLAVLPLGGART